MKAQRRTPIAASFTCVLFVWALHFILTPNEEQEYEHGEQLSIASLRADEEIVISTLVAHGRAHGREYRIWRKDHELMLAIFDTTPAWSRDDRKEDATLLLVRSLSESEVEGISETIGYCRESRETIDSTIRYTDFRYVREGEEIGAESYIGFRLLSQLGWLEREGGRRDPELVEDYDRLAAHFGISAERLDRMIAFETLEQEAPSQ